MILPEMDYLLSVQRMVNDIVENSEVVSICWDYIQLTPKAFFVLFPDGGTVYFDGYVNGKRSIQRSGTYKGVKFFSVE